MSATNTVLPPPEERYTVLGWLRKNLFQTWLSSLVSVVLGYLMIRVFFGVGRWVVTKADWQVILTNMQILMIGRYPVDQIWRVWVVVGLLGLLIGLSWGIWIRQRFSATLVALGAPFLLALLPLDPSTRLHWVIIGSIVLAAYGLGRTFSRFLRRPVVAAWLIYLPVTVLLVSGWSKAGGPVPLVPTNAWGGLLLSTLIAMIGFVLSFPIGVALAIGRRSRYPLIRAFCVVYIELVRAVPLITVFFMAQTMLPLFLPQNIKIDQVIRAMTAFTLFSAAYMAENVRGGLQAVSKGQHEAAAALGLNSFLSLRLIILPQALRSIIPIITASAIGGYRDTSLVLIVGLLDFLGIAKATLAQSAFLGRHIEVYTFLAAVYWLVSYTMSYIGQVIEERTGVENQRRA